MTDELDPGAAALLDELRDATALARPAPDFAVQLRARLLATEPVAPASLLHRRSRRVLVAVLAAAAILALLVSGFTLGDDGHPAIASATAEGVIATVTAVATSAP